MLHLLSCKLPYFFQLQAYVSLLVQYIVTVKPWLHLWQNVVHNYVKLENARNVVVCWTKLVTTYKRQKYIVGMFQVYMPIYPVLSLVQVRGLFTSSVVGVYFYNDRTIWWTHVLYVWSPALLNLQILTNGIWTEILVNENCFTTSHQNIFSSQRLPSLWMFTKIFKLCHVLTPVSLFTEWQHLQTALVSFYAACVDTFIRLDVCHVSSVPSAEL